jgi:hypothetical protein
MKNRFSQKAVIVSLLILLIAALACSNSVEPALVTTAEPTSDSSELSSAKSEGENASEPMANASQKYNIGDVVEIGSDVLVILGWEEVPETDFFKPDAGKKFIAVELVIVNKGQSSRSISTLLQTSVKDETDQKYDPDFMASSALDGASVDGELVPGEKVRGKVGFQVPETVTNLEFVFDASLFGTGKIFINLGGIPAKVDAPAEIQGETTQQTYNVGDTIALGTNTLVVNDVTYPPGGQFAQPKPGNKFIVVDITFENKGVEAVLVSSLLQMKLKDSDGNKYGVDLMATTSAEGSSVDGEIAPGERVRGQIGFQIPESVLGLIFVFDADVWGSGKVFIALP